MYCIVNHVIIECSSISQCSVWRVHLRVAGSKPCVLHCWNIHSVIFIDGGSLLYAMSEKITRFRLSVIRYWAIKNYFTSTGMETVDGAIAARPKRMTLLSCVIY